MVRISCLTWFFILTAVFCNGQNSVQWGNLQRGKYDIGFRVDMRYDRTRKYLRMNQSDSNNLHDRPIQIAIWYPAAKSKSDEYMSYAQYLDLWATEHGAHDERWKATELFVLKKNGLSDYLSSTISEDQFQKLFDVRVPVVKNAAAAKGKFPVIITLEMGGFVNFSLLYEYLASHGFIVINIPWIGTNPAMHGREEAGAFAIQTQVADIGFACAYARELAFTSDQVAYIGLNSASALAAHLQHRYFDALVNIQSFYSDDVLSDTTDFAWRNLTIPVLDIYSVNEFNGTRSLLKSARYSDRYYLDYVDTASMLHRDISMMPRIAQPLHRERQKAFDWVITSVNTFLQAKLYKNPEAMHQLNGWKTDSRAVFQLLNARESVVTEEQFLSWIRFGKIDLATQEYLQVKRVDSSVKLFREAPMGLTVSYMQIDQDPVYILKADSLLLNEYPFSRRGIGVAYNVGYKMIQENKPAIAVRFFKLLTKALPASANAYDSLADAYFALNDKIQSAYYADIALKLIDADPYLDDRSRISVRQSAMKKIK